MSSARGSRRVVGLRSASRLLLVIALVSTLLAAFLVPAPWAPVAFAQEPGPGAAAEPLPDDGAVAPAAVLDTPQLVIGENFVRYAFGGNLLHWEDHCFPPIEFAASGGDGAESTAQLTAAQPLGPAAVDAENSAFLKRKPAEGYVGSTTLATEGVRPACYTYEMLSADADGVFYYDFGTPAHIEYRPSGDFATPIPVMNVAGGTTPVGVRMASDSTYIYWLTTTSVIRARKDGTSTSAEVVADGFSYPADLLIVGTTLYIADDETQGSASDGIWSIPLTGSSSCAATGQPCQETRISFVGGMHLLYRFVPGFNIFSSRSEILWVNHFNEQIRRYSCPLFSALCDESVAYQIPVDGKLWYIGRPAVYGTTLFFHEGTSTGGNIDRVRRLALGGSPQELAPTAAYTGGSPVAVSGDYVYFYDRTAGQENRLYRLSVNATPITRDLFAEAVEVTQGIQNIANGVPLTAQKTTYVRVYGRQLAGPVANGVRAVLEGRNASTNALLPGSPLQPLNGTRSLSTSTSWTRENVNSSWLFKLPASWINAGSIRLTARLDPSVTYADPNMANNSLLRTVSFGNVPPACAIYVPVRTHNPIPSTNLPNFWDMTGRFQRMWPTPKMLHYSTTWQVQELQTCWAGPFPYPCGGPLELDQGSEWDNWIPDRDKVIMELWAYNLVHNAPACDDAGSYTHVMGMVHPSAATGGTLGYASTISGESWVRLPPASPNPFPDAWSSMGEAGTMAQELSHNLGRKHVDCGDPDSVDGSYPYSPCTIGPSGQTQFYGFDIKTLAAIGPNSARDYMSYSDPAWTSDYTWKAIRNQLTTAAAASTPSAQAADVQASFGLLVSEAGTVVATGHLNLDPENLLGVIESTTTYEQGVPSLDMLGKMAEVVVADYNPEAAAAAAPDHGGVPDATNFHLRLLGTNGAVLADKALKLLPIDDHHPDVQSQIWLASFAAPTAQVVSVQLLADNKLLDEELPGIRKPVVSMQAPGNGVVISDTLNVRWTASDPDLDDLSFIVQYSYNSGADWQALDADFPGNPSGSYQISVNDLSALHGSGQDAARVRIIANDGYNTKVVTSPPFTLPNRPPTAAIMDPSPGTFNAPNLPILFDGMGTDAEDGALAGSKLTWKLGSSVIGNDTTLILNGLAPGNYGVTLEARDAQNQLGTDTSELRVAPLSIPQAGGAVLDGLCDDPNYAGATQVSLKPYGPGLAGAGNVLLMRDSTYLWACFTGLKRGAESPVANVGLRFDVNDSSETTAQPSDFGFFAQENGGAFTRQGNGSGFLNAVGPGGLQAMVVTNAATNLWSAEMRIDGAVLGGWNHVVGMMASHEDVSAANDDYTWPYALAAPGLNAPSTWATTVLGMMPAITSLDPISFTVGGPDITLILEATNVVNGARVLWNGIEISPTVVSAAAVGALTPEEAATLEAERQMAAAGLIPESPAAPSAVAASTQISVTLPASLRTSAGPVSLVVENPGPIASPAVQVLVGNNAPVLTSLAPSSRVATSPAFVLTVNGSGFMNGAVVVWEGVELTTTFVGPTQVTAQVPAQLLAQGNPEGAGILVRNPAPTVKDSNALSFFILPPFNIYQFLPLAER